MWRLPEIKQLVTEQGYQLGRSGRAFAAGRRRLSTTTGADWCRRLLRFLFQVVVAAAFVGTGSSGRHVVAIFTAIRLLGHVDLDTLDVLVSEDVILGGILVRIFEIAEVATVRGCLVTLSLPDRSPAAFWTSSLFFFSLSRAFLEPDLDYPFRQADLAAKSSAFGHGRSFVVGEKRLHHHADLIGAHLRPESFVLVTRAGHAGV